MRNCNATLTTATHHPKGGGFTLHTLECKATHEHKVHVLYGKNQYGDSQAVTWSDSTPGAVPHKDDVTVSDAEVDAALRSMWPNEPYLPESREGMRAALLAAKRASKDQS